MDWQINLERLQADLRELSEIGKDPENGGIYRMALTPEDLRAREWLAGRMRDAGLEVSIDGAGNVSGLLPGQDSEAPRLLIGSHIDTVPCAGALDGTLGVLSGLEVLRQMRERRQVPSMPVELISFTDEEGRFGGMFGSQALVGSVTPETLDQAADLDGNLLSEALQAAGLEPWKALAASRPPGSVSRYLELHIEQGPVLFNAGESVGIVEAITGLFKWRISLRGEANHAGTTPMSHRRDAFMGLADFSHEIPRVIDEYGSEHSRATVGKIELYPGSANTVPGEAIFSLDVRDTKAETIEDLEDAIRRVLSSIARRRHLRFNFEVESELAPVDCDPELVGVLRQEASKLGLSHRVMPSGAAHDAQILASIAPVGMIFVASRDGRSHSPAEWSAWEDIRAGANLLLHSVVNLTLKACP